MRALSDINRENMVRMALSAPSPEDQKCRLGTLYEAKIISGSDYQWLLAMNGLRNA